MRKGYSIDLRMLAVSDALSRQNMAETSRLYGIRYETLRGWLNLYHETGGPRRGKTLEPYKLNWEELRQEVEKHPDLFLSEYAEKFGVVVSTISKALHKMGITRELKEDF